MDIEKKVPEMTERERIHSSYYIATHEGWSACKVCGRPVPPVGETDVLEDKTDVYPDRNPYCELCVEAGLYEESTFDFNDLFN